MTDRRSSDEVLALFVLTHSDAMSVLLSPSVTVFRAIGTGLLASHSAWLKAAFAPAET